MLLQVFAFFIIFNQYSKFLKEQDNALNNAIDELTVSNKKQTILNNQLCSKNDELQTFTHIMSHDLKAPLRSIGSFSDLIVNKLKLQGNEKEYFSYIKKAVTSMNKLIDDLLMYARVDQTSNSNFIPVNLNEVVAKIEDAYEFEIKNNKLKFDFENLPAVFGSSELLGTIFNNLISNAIKYQPKDNANHIPQIAIFAKSTDDEEIIYVKDNGIGIDEKFKSKLFTAFKRFHTSSEYEGTGLGLTICLRVIQKLNGKLSLAESSNNGTTFKLQFKKINKNVAAQKPILLNVILH